MKLEDFIRETLVSIVNGVEAAQKETGQGIVNPSAIMIGADGVPKNKHYVRPNNPVDFISFDVAVTTDEKGGSGGKGSIKVFSLELGADLKSESHETNVSRVKFEIPLVLPQSGEFSSRQRKP
ncbi:MAG TPA: hypothetical protein PKW21_03720 [Rhabdaerophilum sp.]|nr:hypothetical protein [Rhabdaerophilum sp.]